MTLIRKGVHTRVVQFSGLYESAAELLPSLHGKLAEPERSPEVTYEFCLVEDIAEHRANAGEYELERPAHEDGKPPLRAWAIHTTQRITIRCADYDLLLELYFMLLHWPESRLENYRTERDRRIIKEGE